MKTSTILMAAAVIIAIVLFNERVDRVPAAKPTAAETAQRDQARADIAAKVQMMVDKGGITKIDTDMHRAWIDPLLWVKSDAQMKQQITEMLAIYCGGRIDLYNAQSARQVASYRLGDGFKAY
jgi:hypothetical protein